MAKTKTDVTAEKEAVYIEKNNRDDTERYVSTDQRKCLVKTDKTVEVPPDVAEAVLLAQMQKRAASKHVESHRYDPFKS